MDDVRMRHQDTRCVHGSDLHDERGAVVTPIYQTSTFKFRDVDHGAALFAGTEKGYIYTRVGNPTVEGCEKAVAVLENGFMGLGCGSGMAAAHLVFATFLGEGDHVICSEAVYGPVTALLGSVMKGFGIEADFVDTSDLGAIKAAMKKNTKLIHIETPCNPTMVVSDIAAISVLAHENGARVCVDNTFMSPILQKPLDHGADIVMHSMTKFLNGHADVVAGMVVPKTEEDFCTLRDTHIKVGGCMDPFNAFLVARGIKTLAIRIERHCESAMKIAKFLENHPKVDRVMYPGLPDHPQYDVHNKQSTGPGALISFELTGGLEAGKILMNNVKLCTLAVSLGGVESLVQHPASMTHSGMSPEARAKAGITDGLVRISVGIEDADEIIADLDQGMALIGTTETAHAVETERSDA